MSELEFLEAALNTGRETGDIICTLNGKHLDIIQNVITDKWEITYNREKLNKKLPSRSKAIKYCMDNLKW